MGMARGARAYPFQAEAGAEPLWLDRDCLWGPIWLLEGKDNDLVEAPLISWLNSSEPLATPTGAGGEGSGY